MALSFGVSIPFVEHLGFSLERFEGGASELRFTPRAEHLNSFAVTHGGACMTLLDVTMAAAARSVRAEMGVVTIEMKTSFMRPGQGKLVAKGRRAAAINPPLKPLPAHSGATAWTRSLASRFPR